MQFSEAIIIIYIHAAFFFIFDVVTLFLLDLVFLFNNIYFCGYNSQVRC